MAVAARKPNKHLTLLAVGCSTGYAATVPLVIKAQGKVDALVAQAYTELDDSHVDLDRVFDSHTGIAHTRWATHGMPNSINSHPQVQAAASCCSARFCVLLQYSRCADHAKPVT